MADDILKTISATLAKVSKTQLEELFLVANGPESAELVEELKSKDISNLAVVKSGMNHCISRFIENITKSARAIVRSNYPILSLNGEIDVEGFADEKIVDSLSIAIKTYEPARGASLKTWVLGHFKFSIKGGFTTSVTLSELQRQQDSEPTSTFDEDKENQTESASIPPSRLSSAQRSLDLLNYASKNASFTCCEAHEFLRSKGYKCSTKSVARSLEILVDNKSLKKLPEKRGRQNVFSKLTSSLPATDRDLSPQSFRDLFFLKAYLEAMEHLPILRGASNLIKYLSSTFPENIRKQLESKIRFGHREVKAANPVEQGVIEAINQAFVKSVCLEIEYYSAHAATKKELAYKAYTICPIGVIFRDGVPYLAALDMVASTQPKLFSLPRIKSISLSNTAAPKKIPSLKSLFAGSFGPYMAQEQIFTRLFFEPEVGSYIAERIWHDSQIMEALPDGSVKLSLQVGHTPDFVGWLLSFGSKCKVLEPESLKFEVKAIARDIYEVYNEGKKAG